MIEIVPATPELIDQFYPGVARPSLRALVVLEDNTPAGVAGFYRVQNGVLLFSDVQDETKKKTHPLTTTKVLRRLLALADQHGWAVFAIAEEGLGASQRFLQRYGFKLMDERSQTYKRLPGWQD